MGKTRTFKADNRDFTKDIQNLMNRKARKEKQKSEALEMDQRSRVIQDEGSSIEVSKKGNTSEVDFKKNCDEDLKTTLEAQGSTND